MVVILLYYHAQEIDVDIALGNILIYHEHDAALGVLLLLIAIRCMAEISKPIIVFGGEVVPIVHQALLETGIDLLQLVAVAKGNRCCRLGPQVICTLKYCVPPQCSHACHCFVPCF
jgi:hypothetical protein